MTKITEVKSLLDEVDDGMEGIEKLLSFDVTTQPTSSRSSAAVEVKKFSLSQMLHCQETSHPFTRDVAVTCENSDELRLDVDRMRTELEELRVSVRKGDALDRGVGDSLISTRDESTAMTARSSGHLSNGRCRLVPKIALGTIEGVIDDAGLADRVFTESTSTITNGTSVYDEASRDAGRRRDVVGSSDEHWQLLMRSAEASRRILRNRAIAASRNQPLILDSDGARKYSVPLPQSCAMRTGLGVGITAADVGVPEDDRTSRSERSMLPRRPLGNTRYHSIDFAESAEARTESLRTWLFGT